MKIRSLVSALCLLAGTGVPVEAAFVNGSFETGDYQGWSLSETPESWQDPATQYLYDLTVMGTWGICQDGETLVFEGEKYDYADSVLTTLRSPGLPKICVPSEGTFLAFQNQVAGQVHLMSQDVDLPVNADTLSWEMMYRNHNKMSPYFRGDQRIRVALKTLDGELLDVLFVTDEGKPLSVASWLTYSADVSAYAGRSVRFEVEVSTFWAPLDAYFDNFRVELGELPVSADPVEADEPVEAPVVDETNENPASDNMAAVPPGWQNKVNVPAGIEKKGTSPNGFDKGQKSGW